LATTHGIAATGFGLLSQGYETMSYTLLDLASKVGFGFLSLNSLYQLEGQKSQVDLDLKPN
jgi:sensory rhodopsin